MQTYEWLTENKEKEGKTAEGTAFAFRIFCNHFSDCDWNFFPCHWHSEVEFVRIEDGEMEYLVNGRPYRLNAGNGIFVNSGIPHAAEISGNGADCIYRIYRLDPAIVCGGRDTAVYHRYVSSAGFPSGPDARYLDGSSAVGSGIFSLLSEAEALCHTPEDGYELSVTEKLCALWRLLYPELSDTPSPNGRRNRKETGILTDMNRLKTALGFIQSHYGEDITLQDIADSCRISRGECCHLFKRSLRQTPLSCLLHYRIQMSLILLAQDELSIGEIARKLGFHGSSYYAETFKNLMHCSPSEYRKTHRNVV